MPVVEKMRSKIERPDDGGAGFACDPGEPIRQLGIRSELFDQTGNVVSSEPSTLLARDDEPVELADEIGGSDGAVAGRG
jgi:hypothetical protein